MFVARFRLEKLLIDCPLCGILEYADERPVLAVQRPSISLLKHGISSRCTAQQNRRPTHRSQIVFVSVPPPSDKRSRDGSRTLSLSAQLRPHHKMQKVGAGEVAYSTPTEPLIDSYFDSLKCQKNKKAHIIMGLNVVSGGEGGIRTRGRLLTYARFPGV